jgi:glycosyltransferase involved in cell wall biosynthesis
MKTAAIFNPYWETLGGGEKYIATAIQAYLESGYHPIILWNDVALAKKIIDRFGIDISQSEINPKLYSLFSSGSPLTRIKHSSSFDSFLWLSDGSVPALASKNNLLHFQVPFNNKVPFATRVKVKNFKHIICNSKYTKSVIDKNYSISSSVLYPPVTQMPEHNKENYILSIGRFDNFLHSKRQDFLIETFKKLNLSKWKLILAGGSHDSKENIKKLRAQIGGEQIELIVNPSFEEMRELYSKASIYWHAAGFGSDLDKYPEKAEHFGIATVEAMSAGAIPIVYAAGGQLEIVHDQENGYLWKMPEELITITKNVITDISQHQHMSKRAIDSAAQFGKEQFIHEFKQYLS